MPISRRRFIEYGAISLLGIAPLPAVPWAPAPERRSSRRTLVILFLRGGFDGLSAVVPHGDPHYARLRPTIAVRDALDLDGFFGLHPALAPLTPLFASGALGIVHAAGVPNASGAHGDAQARLRAAMRHLAAAPFGARPSRGASHPHAGGSAAYPPSSLGARLHDLAALIKQQRGPETCWVDVPGWDYHVRQGGTRGAMADRLRDLSESLAAFHRDLGDRIERVTVATVTEFGRAAAENRTGGTDHGRGSVMLILGGGVSGGQVYGRWPGLGADQLHERGLAVTTDIRAVLDELHPGRGAGHAVFRPRPGAG